MKNVKQSVSLLSAASLMALALAVPASAGEMHTKDTKMMESTILDKTMLKPVSHLETQKFRVKVENISQPMNNPNGEAVNLHLSPGVWAVHLPHIQLFEYGTPDKGMGLEQIAEAGDPLILGDNLRFLPGIHYSDTFVSSHKSLFPSKAASGDGYSFVVKASPGEKLSFATMVVESNDMFIAPTNGGIELFDANGIPLSGDITSQISLWDAGTENNELLGLGMAQAHTQDDADDGESTVQAILPVMDLNGQAGNVAPMLVRVTIEPIE